MHEGERMKYKCLISHETPTPDGGFNRYEAGKEYEGISMSNPNFEPVKTTTRKTKTEGIDDGNA